MPDVDLNPKKENVLLISKYPLPFTVGVFIILLSIFIGRSFVTDSSKSEQCQSVVIAERQRADKAEQKADDTQKQLVNILLMDKDRQDNEKRYRDSVLRASVGNKAKQIIKNSK